MLSTRTQKGKTTFCLIPFMWISKQANLTRDFGSQDRGYRARGLGGWWCRVDLLCEDPRRCALWGCTALCGEGWSGLSAQGSARLCARTPNSLRPLDCPPVCKQSKRSWTWPVWLGLVHAFWLLVGGFLASESRDERPWWSQLLTPLFWVRTSSLL